ncbi:hypothetical protein RD110_11020 [Rhodoferax koreense]|uniref:Uncharacterized protein n=1 Tax=Rhodoferax koreensis TaxID=1842727 RepID=A0A1P8JV97_9BURK|nr:hypothetical protein [Rhodoferax koreense]APW37658.1 hypothetical protein RD110_11020 [Rhodoferax koreense]
MPVVRPASIDFEAAVQGLTPAFDLSEVHNACTWVTKCQQDMAQLWRDGSLWAVTEVVETKRGRALHFVAMAGDYVDSLRIEIEAWGKSVGCNKAFFTGRKGWAKRLPAYRIRTVTLEKDI